MQTAEQQKASVMLIRGHGEQRLRQAIMQGLIKDDLVSDANEVLRANEQLKREIASLKRRLDSEKTRANTLEHAIHDAFDAQEREEKRERNLYTAKVIGFIAVGIFAIIFVSSVITNLIF